MDIAVTQELAIRQMHSDGASTDEICNVLNLPLVVVEEVLDMQLIDSPDCVALPIIEDMPLEKKEVVYDKILKYTNFLADATIQNLNNPEALNSIGKASQIFGNLTSSMERLKGGEVDRDRNKFSKYLKD